MPAGLMGSLVLLLGLLDTAVDLMAMFALRLGLLAVAVDLMATLVLRPELVVSVVDLMLALVVGLVLLAIVFDLMLPLVFLQGFLRLLDLFGPDLSQADSRHPKTRLRRMLNQNVVGSVLALAAVAITFFVQGSGWQGLGLAPQRPDFDVGRPRYSASRSDSFPPLDVAAGRCHLSLRVSKAIFCFARCPHRRSAGWQVAEDGSLDVRSGPTGVAHWGSVARHSSSTSRRTPSAVRVADASCSAATVAESLQRRPRRRHRRRAASASGEATLILCDLPLPDTQTDVAPVCEPLDL